MACVRLRHPKGVSTLELPQDDPTLTVWDFQQQICSISEILPSRQTVKTGYPPRSLTLIPELPFSSLGITAGDQIIVSEIPESDLTGGVAQDITTRPPQLPGPVEVTHTSSTPLSSAVGRPDFVEAGDGTVLVHRVVPDDNSCLFSATALVFEQNIANAQGMRKIVANGIRNDSETYNEAILGMPPEQYIQTILKPTTWGGAIELSILAQHYGVEIASIDVETGRIDRFSPSENKSIRMCCALIYSGIHYDAASLAPMVDAPPEWHQTLFSIGFGEDDPIITALRRLADILRLKKAYTNTTTFKLKCEQCRKGLKGEKEARVHAEETGHVHFGEY